MDHWKIQVPLNDTVVLGLCTFTSDIITSSKVRIQGYAFPSCRWRQTFFCKSQIVNILGFAGHMVSVIAIQPCCCSVKAVVENTYTSKCGCVALKFEFYIIFTRHETFFFLKM